MNEYPIPIAHATTGFMAQWDGEEFTFTWSLVYVREGIYQLTATDNNGQEVHSRTYVLEQVLHLYRTWFPARGSFYVGETAYPLQDILPSDDDVIFMLRVFVHSSPYYNDGSMLDYCDECSVAVPLHDEDDHGRCNHCDKLEPINIMTDWEVHGTGDDPEQFYLCQECQAAGIDVGDSDQISTCNHCEEYWWRGTFEIVMRTVTGHGEIMICDYCSENYYSCEECGTLGEWEDVQEDDFGTIRCAGCADGDFSGELVAAWNFRPELVFHPALPVDPLKPLYIGIELEIQWRGWQRNDEAREWLQMVKVDHGNVCYAKGDSSINDGFELVTHPMSPAWALENFPFSILDEAIELGAEPKHPSTGIHIHIDRGALTTAQLWKLLKVHDSQRELCGLIGGRGTNSDYADWDNDYKIVNENMFKIARRKGEAYGDAARYVPVNLQNVDTIELRYMEGSIKTEDVKKNIQWVQALYDFTDFISVEDVKNGVLESPGFLLGWITDNTKIYPDLAGHVNKRIMAPVAMPVRS